jgi:hypothetical protein
MAAPMSNWQQVIYRVKAAPGGTVRNSAFDFVLDDGQVDQNSAPNRSTELAIDDLVERQWQMVKEVGQPSWYKMTVSVFSTGKYSVDFEYKDDYKEGDISRERS